MTNFEDLQNLLEGLDKSDINSIQNSGHEDDLLQELSAEILDLFDREFKFHDL